MQTKTAVSAGGVIFRQRGGKLEIAVASRAGSKTVSVSPRRTSSNSVEMQEGSRQVWCLPKGAVEEGENLKQTAVRETREETGLTGEVVEKIGQIDYWFYWKPEKARYHKFVHFYLLKYVEGTTQDHDFEVSEVKWLSLDEAEELLSYESEKEIVGKAKRLLANSL